jgi:glycosyltransferase involved in cell wall biosynthesis
MRMNVLLNFLPLKSGGGLQVGLDFAAQARKAGNRHHWFLVATAGTPLAELGAAENFQVLKAVPRSWQARLWFESFGCRRILKTLRPQVVYTQFGPQWPGAARAVNVVGCAYANLCYPEIDFWRRLPPAQRRWRTVVDHLRRRRIQQADAVIFETQDLAERAVKHLRLDPQCVHVVRPSVSSLVGEHVQDPETKTRCDALPPGFRVLLLSVYNPNKNFELLPRIAHALRARARDNDTLFVLTLPQHSPQWHALRSAAQALGVADRLINLGPVPQHGCAELYRACDAVILPSQLESFSNTIAESWAMSRPLLIGDLPWARALCGRAAAYFPYDSHIAAAQRLLELRHDAARRAELVAAGRRQLAQYSTPEQRFRQYLDILEHHAKP